MSLSPLANPYPPHSVGTAVEHHTLYQYQLYHTTDIFMGQIQTETAYYQPNPPAPIPFTPIAALNDPDFAAYCAGHSGTCADGWGLRVLDSQNIFVYGAGLYSFFSNYSTGTSSPFPFIPTLSTPLRKFPNSQIPH
jgi:glucan 1,3-beta-glucosidase